MVSRPNFSDLNPILAAGNATINLISKGKRPTFKHSVLYYHCQVAPSMSYDLGTQAYPT